MKKKVLSMVLIGTLVAGVAGCGNSESAKVTDPPATVQAEVKAEEQQEEKVETVAVVETQQVKEQENVAVNTKETVAITEFEGMFTEVPFTFDGMEMMLPQELDTLLETGWYMRDKETIDAKGEQTITLYNDMYAQTRIMVGIENLTENALSADECVMTSISVKNTYLEFIADTYPEVNYCGVTFGMSRDEVISALGEPARETENEPTYEKDGTLHIMNYSEDGMSAEIWVYENLGVTQYRLSTF